MSKLECAKLETSRAIPRIARQFESSGSNLAAREAVRVTQLARMESPRPCALSVMTLVDSEAATGLSNNPKNVAPLPAKR